MIRSMEFGYSGTFHRALDDLRWKAGIAPGEPVGQVALERKVGYGPFSEILTGSIVEAVAYIETEDGAPIPLRYRLCLAQ